MNVISLSGLTMSYTRAESKTTVFDGLDLDFEKGSLTTLLGPSACGKTTLLRLIARLDEPISGKVIIHGESVGYAIQQAPMLPWRTLGENAGIGLEIQNNSKESFRSVIADYFDAFGLANCQDIFPDAASGGMKQRVALIRTLVVKPSILLLDEPFSNLDFDIKLKVQRQLIEFQKNNNATIILVTHDIEDAIALSNRVIIFSEKPTLIKREFNIDLGLKQRHPVEARVSLNFRQYFQNIWDELKYLDKN